MHADGRIARPLEEGQLHAVHDKLDKNSDGKASLAEVMGFWKDTRAGIAKKVAPGIIKKMDRDGDGVVSLDDILKDEVFTKMDPESEVVQDHMFLEGKKFMAADANKDKVLDESEIHHFFFPELHDGVQEHMAERMMQLRDKNKDGYLSEEEFVNEKQNRTWNDFNDLDKNQDDKLEQEELKAWESGHHHTEQAMTKLIETVDEDGDGHISKAELSKSREAIAATDAHFHLAEWAKHHEL